MAEVHEWMFQTEEDKSNLDIITELRDGVNELDPTTGTFRLHDVTDYHPTVFKSEFIWIVGSWRLPDRIEPSRVNRYVNPNYVHRGVYSDINAECKCGVLVGDNYGEPWRRIDYHNPNCKAKWRSQVQDVISRRRDETIKKYAQMYLEVSDVAPRMGMDPNKLTKYIVQNDIDWARLRAKGRRRTVETWRVLNKEYDHTYAQIAKAWDFSPSAVRSYTSYYNKHFEDSL